MGMCLIELDIESLGGGDSVQQVREVIEQARKDKGWTKTELSKRTGIAYQNLWASLKGSRTIPASEFVGLCAALDLSIDDFTD